MSVADSSPQSSPEYVTSGLMRLTRPQLIGTMLGLLLAALLAAIDQTIVGTAEPRIIASLSGFDRYPWVATLYLLSSTVSVPIFASLSDRQGRKPFFMTGVILFVVSSALCGAAGKLTFLPFDGMGQLIVFRGIQGVGAGMITGVLFTIVGDIFSPRERGKYQGLFAAIFGLASIFGPTLGGWLTDHWSWRACFYVNVPVGIVAVAALYFEFPNMKPRQSAHQIDWSGFALLIATFVPLLLALTWAPQHGWGSLRVWPLLTLAAVMLFGFIANERRASEPVIPLDLFKDSIIAVCSVCSFILGMGMFGVVIYLPLYMQGVLGTSATQSGNLLTPLLMGAVVGAIIGGQTISRTGEYKALGIIGSILLAIGMVLFSRMDAVTAHRFVVVAMVIAGVGMGLLQPVYTLAVQNVAPRDRMGTATSSTIFFRSIGSTVGVAAFGSVMLMRYHAEFLKLVPPGLPDAAMPYLLNPLLLSQARPQLAAILVNTPGGLAMVQPLIQSVKTALMLGLQEVFLMGAVLMSLAVLPHLFLRREPLTTRQVSPDVAPAAH
jgi:EmrB/QacA subfamily drug resistance transporter